MKVEAGELVFMKEHAPSNFAALIAENTGVSRSNINNELTRIKKDYNEVVINEARRLLKAIKNIEYKPAKSK